VPRGERGGVVVVSIFVPRTCGFDVEETGFAARVHDIH